MKKELTQSQFSMWRTIVALIHVDGKVTSGESQHLIETFKKLPFTEEQKKTLADDVKTPQNIDLLFGQITTPADRSQFIYFARLLFWSDGDLAQQEHEVLKRLGEKVMSQVNFNQVNLETDSLAQEATKTPMSLSRLLTRFAEQFFG